LGSTQKEAEISPALIDATRLWTLALPAVSAFITSLLRDFRDRDDVLQETAVAVLESFDHYDPELPFVAWAIGVARNQVRLHCRRQNRQNLAFDSEAVDALARAFVQRNADDPRLDHLGECVQALDSHSRELCRLRYDQDMKPAAIGERLGRAANTVAKELQRVRDRLRDCIERKVKEARA
jgi:RNA polymerase sigma-70 factor, ECF subfamily